MATFDSDADRAVTVAEDQGDLSELVGEIGFPLDRIMITRHGRPVAILVSPDYLESLEETISVLSSPEAMRQLMESREEMEAGDVCDADESAAGA